jgi:hypothetical protein
MPSNDRIRQLFEELVALIEKHDSPSLAQAAVLSAAEGKLDDFIKSNELWGGPGSIADQAGLKAGRTEGRKEIERALIALGKEQVAQGKVNPRTAGWVNTFLEWNDKGI